MAHPRPRIRNANRPWLPRPLRAESKGSGVRRNPNISKARSIGRPHGVLVPVDTGIHITKRLVSHRIHANEAVITPVINKGYGRSIGGPSQIPRASHDCYGILHLFSRGLHREDLSCSQEGNNVSFRRYCCSVAFG